jgi:tetratricopeptide (TPR) repeat protein
MGVQLRRSLLDAAPEDQREALGAALPGINFTNIALTTLEDNIFGGRSRRSTASSRASRWCGRSCSRRWPYAARPRPARPRDRPAGAGAGDPARAAGRRAPGHADLDQQHGLLLQTQGKLSEAEPYYREALEGNRRVLGDEHPDTLSSHQQHGRPAPITGQAVRGRAVLPRGARGRAAACWATSTRTRCTSINNMGALLHVPGQAVRGRAVLPRGARGQPPRAGRRAPGHADLDQQHGRPAQAQGKLSEAEPYYREALEGRRRVLGDEHPDTLTSINNMGVLLQASRASCPRPSRTSARRWRSAAACWATSTRTR